MRHAVLALGLLTALPAVAGTVPPGLTVFDLEVDPRLCPSPACGGFWVEEVNLRSQPCPDGTTGRACYVADLDLSLLGLSPRHEARVRAAIVAGTVLVAGSYAPHPWPGFVLYDLVVEKFWWDPS